MKTLAIISHKGGAGKTSSAVMLAEEFARRGQKVLLVDADRQKGAGLLLGIEQPDNSVQQTRNPRLRYFCTSGLPIRQLASKAASFRAEFDVAVVDTPSLDDPLARAWLQHSQFILMVIPVEPISIRTLDAADAALMQVKTLNPDVDSLGSLATIFDENDATQRALLMELMSSRPEGLLPVVIPRDAGLMHRAEQKEERRSEASEVCMQAYSKAADQLCQDMELGGASTLPAAARRPSVPAVRITPMPAAAGPTGATPARAGGNGFGLLWAAAVAIALVVIGLVVVAMKMGGGAKTSSADHAHQFSRIVRVEQEQQFRLQKERRGW
jgi:cellulose biosynthesis protein BcsQ